MPADFALHLFDALAIWHLFIHALNIGLRLHLDLALKDLTVLLLDLRSWQAIEYRLLWTLFSIGLGNFDGRCTRLILVDRMQLHLLAR